MSATAATRRIDPAAAITPLWGVHSRASLTEVRTSVGNARRRLASAAATLTAAPWTGAMKR